MVIVDRYLANSARKRHRKLATRVHVAKEHVSNGVAGLAAGEPRLQDDRHVLGNPINREWRPFINTTTVGFPVA